MELGHEKGLHSWFWPVHYTLISTRSARLGVALRDLRQLLRVRFKIPANVGILFYQVFFLLGFLTTFLREVRERKILRTDPIFVMH